MGYKKVAVLYGIVPPKKETQAFCNTTGTRTLVKNTTCERSRDSRLAEVVSNLPAIIKLTQNGEHATHYEALTIRLDKGKRRSSKLKRKT